MFWRRQATVRFSASHTVHGAYLIVLLALWSKMLRDAPVPLALMTALISSRAWIVYNRRVAETRV